MIDQNKIDKNYKLVIRREEPNSNKLIIKINGKQFEPDLKIAISPINKNSLCFYGPHGEPNVEFIDEMGIFLNTNRSNTLGWLSHLSSVNFDSGIIRVNDVSEIKYINEIIRVIEYQNKEQLNQYIDSFIKNLFTEGISIKVREIKINKDDEMVPSFSDSDKMVYSAIIIFQKIEQSKKDTFLEFLKSDKVIELNKQLESTAHVKTKSFQNENIIKKGKLKSTSLLIGNHEAFTVHGIPENMEVKITNEENHHIYGKRYKIIGYDEWFEENCFEYVKEL